MTTKRPVTIVVDGVRVMMPHTDRRNFWDEAQGKRVTLTEPAEHRLVFESLVPCDKYGIARWDGRRVTTDWQKWHCTALGCYAFVFVNPDAILGLIERAAS